MDLYSANSTEICLPFNNWYYLNSVRYIEFGGIKDQDEMAASHYNTDHLGIASNIVDNLEHNEILMVSNLCLNQKELSHSKKSSKRFSFTLALRFQKSYLTNHSLGYQLFSIL